MKLYDFRGASSADNPGPQKLVGATDPVQPSNVFTWGGSYTKPTSPWDQFGTDLVGFWNSYDHPINGNNDFKGWAPKATGCGSEDLSTLQNYSRPYRDGSPVSAYFNQYGAGIVSRSLAPTEKNVKLIVLTYAEDILDTEYAGELQLAFDDSLSFDSGNFGMINLSSGPGYCSISATPGTTTSWQNPNTTNIFRLTLKIANTGGQGYDFYARSIRIIGTYYKLYSLCILTREATPAELSFIYGEMDTRASPAQVATFTFGT